MTDTQTPSNAAPFATHLLASGADIPEEYSTSSGLCCFCGSHASGQSVEKATSEDYFSDDPLLTHPQSDHVCHDCAWVMDQRTFKQGHWIAHSDGTENPSTGDLLDEFGKLRAGEYDTPLAVHVTSSPIRSSHSYLWTPVNESERPLAVAFDRELVRIHDWEAFSELIAAIEDCRLCGFTFDELRSGEPRVRNLREMGRQQYRERDAAIDPHRRTARLELALTLSRSDDDQPRDELTDHDPFTNDD